MTREFDAVIEEGPGGGALVEVPFDVKEVFGSGRPKVRVTFDGHAYRGSVTSMDGRAILGVRKDVRAAIDKDVGDTVRVTLTADTAPRTVDLPPELARALDGSPGSRKRFDALSYTRRKEMARAVADARKAETRTRRVARILEELAGDG